MEKRGVTRDRETPKKRINYGNHGLFCRFVSQGRAQARRRQPETKYDFRWASLFEIRLSAVGFSHGLHDRQA